MTTFRHVVVGLDLSPRELALSPGARAALTHVRWLAESGSIRCTLVHSDAADEVWDPETGRYETLTESSSEPLEQAQAELRDAGIDAELVRTGESALLAMLRRVLEDPADLVLVGKRARPVAGAPKVGSTASRLLRKCPCAVWAVRPDATPPPRCLLAATDLSPVGDVVLEQATGIAAHAGASLHVVHAIQLTMAAQLGAGESQDEFLVRERERANQAIRDELKELGFTGDTELHVGLTSPSRAVLECEARFEPDLVVMGTVSRAGISGLLVGNTAERLLTRLEASLLTVKPADFVCPVRLPD